MRALIAVLATVALVVADLFLAAALAAHSGAAYTVGIVALAVGAMADAVD